MRGAGWYVTVFVRLVCRCAPRNPDEAKKEIQKKVSVCIQGVTFDADLDLFVRGTKSLEERISINRRNINGVN